MWYVRLLCVMALAMSCARSVLIATSDDSLESFDLHHPATLLPIVAKRRHTRRYQLHERRLRELLDAAVTDLRKRIQHARPIPYPPQ